jgi:hypothetical protein
MTSWTSDHKIDFGTNEPVIRRLAARVRAEHPLTRHHHICQADQHPWPCPTAALLMLLGLAPTLEGQ